MKNNKVKEMVVAAEQLELIEEVKNICVESILKSQLNIHINREVFKDILCYCESDVDKINKVVRYANIAGIEAVKQLIKG